MPTIITRGAASAKGFGFTGRARELTTVTFTTNGTWVAPSSVSSVASLTGKGQDGAAGYWTDIEIADGGNVSYVESTAPPTPSTTIESRAQIEWDKFPTVHDPNGTSVSWTYWYYYVGLTMQYPQVALVRVKQGFTKTKVGNGWGATYTPPLPSGNSYSYEVGNMEQYIFPTTGANSSALGYTFVGGAGVPATPVVYSNVSVTPSTSYSIVVPSGGYVVIQYYA